MSETWWKRRFLLNHKCYCNNIEIITCYQNLIFLLNMNIRFWIKFALQVKQTLVHILLSIPDFSFQTEIQCWYFSSHASSLSLTKSIWQPILLSCILLAATGGVTRGNKAATSQVEHFTNLQVTCELEGFRCQIMWKWIWHKLL